MEERKRATRRPRQRRRAKRVQTPEQIIAENFDKGALGGGVLIAFVFGLCCIIGAVFM